ncbi:MAG TPA: hypothetical protein VFM93_02115 [Candidatus Limnocylindria bacterium]|nr:hypothetical protein [Candidatus Limnocylindria bacterium]
MTVVAAAAAPRQARALAGGAVRELAIAGTAALVVAVPVGLVARLLMKVSAVAAGPGAAGTVTENGNVVGDLTLDGTAALILFAGLASAGVGALVYRAAGPWLAAFGRARGAALGLAFLALSGSSVIDPRSVDFARFGPAGLNVAMFVALFLATGVVLAPVVDAVGRAARAPSAPQLAGFAAGLAVSSLLLVSLVAPLATWANSIVLSSGDVAALRTLAALALAIAARWTLGVTPLSYAIVAVPVVHGGLDLAGALRSLLA